jgi:hypothetical protein
MVGGNFKYLPPSPASNPNLCGQAWHSNTRDNKLESLFSTTYAATALGIATIFSCAAFSRSAFLLPPI